MSSRLVMWAPQKPAVWTLRRVLRRTYRKLLPPLDQSALPWTQDITRSSSIGKIHALAVQNLLVLSVQPRTSATAPADAQVLEYRVYLNPRGSKMVKYNCMHRYFIRAPVFYMRISDNSNMLKCWDSKER